MEKTVPRQFFDRIYGGDGESDKNNYGLYPNSTTAALIKTAQGHDSPQTTSPSSSERDTFSAHKEQPQTLQNTPYLTGFSSFSEYNIK